MQKRTKAVAIPPKVRQEVEERDNHQCIFCKSPYCRGEAHYINRSQGGLGIAKNLVTVCSECHRQMDNGKDIERYRKIAREYLMSKYLDWKEEDLIFNKWKGFKYD